MIASQGESTFAGESLAGRGADTVARRADVLVTGGVVLAGVGADPGDREALMVSCLGQTQIE